MKSQIILEKQTIELAQSADALLAANTRTSTILESITDGFFSFDVTGRIVYVNERGAKLAGRDRQQLIGQVLWDVYPDLLGESAGEQLQRAIYENIPVQFETYSQILERWFDMRAYPAGDGLSVYFADISDRKAHEEAQRLVYEAEHELSITLQKAILMSAEAKIPGLSVETYYRPAQDQHLVGGDFHDVFEPAEGYVSFVIGDVAGKGINAAVRTAMAKNALRALAYEDPSPASVLNRLNSIICKDSQDGFITLFYGLLDLKEKELLFSNAGHEPPLWLIPGPSRIVELERPGVILGCLPESQYSQHRIEMDSGHRLLLYTDGFTEARDGDDFFGVERLKAAFLENCQLDNENCISNIVASVMTYAKGVLRDDTAVVLLTLED